MKGDYNDECKRTACSTKPAVYFNHSTRSHYCASCAHLINIYNYSDAQRMFGHDLCTLVKEAPASESQE